MLRLTTLRTRAFRGLIDGPELRFGPGGLLLCGDNGSGKSSYVDAIEKVLTGRCGSLDRRIQGISSQTHGTHIRCTGPPMIELVLTDGGRDIPVTLETDISQLPKSVNSFREAACQQSFILRRRTLLDFIDAPPRERYRAIEGFLNLGRFVALETDLRTKLQETEARLRRAQNQKQKDEGLVRLRVGIGPSELLDAQSCTAKVGEALALVGLPRVQSVSEAQERLDEVEGMLGALPDMETLSKVLILDDKIAEVPSASVLLEASRGYSAVRSEVVDEEAKLKGHFYEEVLTKGLQWIREDSLDFCPLCRSPIDVVEVAKWVETQLEKNQHLTELRQRQAESRQAFREALTKHYEALSAIQTIWEDVIAHKVPALVDRALQGLLALVGAHEDLLPPSRIAQDAEHIGSLSLDTAASTLKQHVQRELRGYPDRQEYERLYQARQRLLAYCNDWPRVLAAEARIQKLTTASSQLEPIVAHAEAGRKSAVQKLLDRVADIAAQYMEAIHPDEQIGRPHLSVREAVRSSLGLQGRFYDRLDDPRGYYSEGHLDSLGLCVFLALRRFHHVRRPDFSLLVLDDVLHSVDGNHRRATANLILNKFSDHQIIITTHDPLWFEYLMGASRGSSGGRRFEYRRITAWTLEDGPKWGDHLSDYEWLKSSVGQEAWPRDRVLKAGRVLEAILQNLCDALKVAVPLRIRGDYTIGPLWENFYKRAKDNHEFRDKAKEHLEAIEQLRRMRNWVGGHWNRWAGQLTDAEARDFSDAVVALRDCTYCDKCRKFVTRISQLEGIWSCEKQCLVYRKRLPSGETT